MRGECCVTAAFTLCSSWADGPRPPAAAAGSATRSCSRGWSAAWRARPAARRPRPKPAAERRCTSAREPSGRAGRAPPSERARFGTRGQAAAGPPRSRPAERLERLHVCCSCMTVYVTVSNGERLVCSGLCNVFCGHRPVQACAVMRSIPQCEDRGYRALTERRSPHQAQRSQCVPSAPPPEAASGR